MHNRTFRQCRASMHAVLLAKCWSRAAFVNHQQRRKWPVHYWLFHVQVHQVDLQYSSRSILRTPGSITRLHFFTAACCHTLLSKTNSPFPLVSPLPPIIFGSGSPFRTAKFPVECTSCRSNYSGEGSKILYSLAVAPKDHFSKNDLCFYGVEKDKEF